MRSEEAARFEPGALGAATLGLGKGGGPGGGLENGRGRPVSIQRIASAWLRGAPVEVALRTKELTHALYRWPAVALGQPACLHVALAYRGAPN